MTYSIAKSAILLLLSMLVVVACGKTDSENSTPLEQNGVDVGRDSAELNSQDSAGSQNTNDLSVSVASGGEKILTCVPGCTLRKPSVDEPEIPEWCLSWTLKMPRCGRRDGKIDCHGKVPGFVAYGEKEYQEFLSGKTEQELEEYFKNLDANKPYINIEDNWRNLFKHALDGKLDRNSESTYEYVCTRLNLSYPKIQEDLGTREQIETGAVENLVASCACEFNLGPAYPEEIKDKPNWCEYATNGGPQGIDVIYSRPVTTANICLNLSFDNL